MTATLEGTQYGVPARSRPAVVGAVLLAVAVVLLGVALATSDRPGTAVVWGSTALATYATGFLCLAGARYDADLGFARWKVGPWTLFWYGASFGLATLTWAAPQNGTATEIDINQVLRALWLVAVGLTMWTLGYLVGPGQPVRDLAQQGMRKLSHRREFEVRGAAAPWVLYTIGLAARLAVTATTGRFGYVGDASSAVSTATGYGQVLSLFTLCAPLAVAAAALQVFRERRPGARITLAILFLAELVFGAAAGGKENFVIAVLAVVIPRSAVRRRLPKTALAVLTLVFLLVIIPFNQAYRSAVRGGSQTLTTQEAISAAPGILRNTVLGHNALAVVPASVNYLLQRIREIDSVAIILQRTPGQIAFAPAAELVEAPIAGIVPRALWPGKPILATGYQFSQEYYGLPGTVYTSSSITPVGDLYRHGGLVPVLAGMLVLGAGVRVLDDALDVRTNPHAVVLVLLLLPDLVKSEQDWVTLLAGIPGTLLVWIFVVMVAFRKRHPA